MAGGWTGGGGRGQGARVAAPVALLLAALAGGPAAAAVVAVSVAADRVVVRLDAPVAGATGLLAPDGRHLRLDFTGTGTGATRLPANPGIAAEPLAGGVRLRLALPRRATVADGGFAADGLTLTLALAAAGPGAAADAAAAGPLRFTPVDLSRWGLGRQPRYRVVRALPPPAGAAALPRVQGAAGRPLVVIDPGHGGADPGAVGVGGLREKDLTLAVARAVRERLLAGGRVRVALTRDDDRFLVLRERFGVARRLHADLFVSIHCDSVADPGAAGAAASGASAYTLSEVASDKEAARLAARENKADVISGVDLGQAGADVGGILIDLTQRETMNASADFARLLGREAAALVPVRPRFHRMASLMVLKAPDLPSVLLETGYLSNPRDAALLASREGQRRLAEAVARAVEVQVAKRLAAR